MTTSSIINLNCLKTHQSIVNLPQYGLVSVSGADAATFLQGQLTCDIHQLQENTANRGSLCNHKGRIISSFYIQQVGQDFWLIMPQNIIHIFLSYIEKFAVFSKVTFTNHSSTHPILGQVGNATAPTYRQALRLPDTLNRHFLITEHTDYQHTHGQSLWHGLNMLAGIADIDHHTTGQFIPQMINLDQFHGVSLTKGCYVGQEVIARATHLGTLKRRLSLLTLDKAQEVHSGQRLSDSNGQSTATVIEYYQDQEQLYVLAVTEDRAKAPFQLMPA